MKYLVIGGSGFIGRHILSYVRSLGHTAIGTRNGHNDASLVKFDLAADRIQNCVGPTFFSESEPIVGVIAGGIVSFDECLDRIDIARVINVDNTIRLIKDLEDLGVKPVFISSQAVYDGETGYHDEARQRNPICEYGRQKADVEQFLEDQSPSSLVLRLDYVVGDTSCEDHLFSRWSEWIENNCPIICMNGQLFSPTYVEDIAQAIALGCQLNLTGFYNLAGPEFFTREELARQFLLIAGLEAKVISKPVTDFGFSDRRPLRSYLDSTKFVTATGMRFTSMRTVMNSFLQNSRTSQTTQEHTSDGHCSSR